METKDQQRWRIQWLGDSTGITYTLPANVWTVNYSQPGWYDWVEDLEEEKIYDFSFGI